MYMTAVSRTLSSRKVNDCHEVVKTSAVAGERRGNLCTVHQNGVRYACLSNFCCGSGLILSSLVLFFSFRLYFCIRIHSFSRAGVSKCLACPSLYEYCSGKPRSVWHARQIQMKKHFRKLLNAPGLVYHNQLLTKVRSL